MESTPEETETSTQPLAGEEAPPPSRISEYAARTLNPYHSDACEGCAGWKDMYEQTLAKLAQRNVEVEMLEARVELVTLDHARDRKELKEAVVKLETLVGQYRALIASAWETVKTAINVLLPSYKRYEAEMLRLAEVGQVDWMDPNQPPPPPLKIQRRPLSEQSFIGESFARFEEEPFPRGGLGKMYGPGPRSGHLPIEGLGKQGPLAGPTGALDKREPKYRSPALRDKLPGMVPGSRGERVVKCGQQCAEAHTYSSPCLLSLPRTEEQEQRHPRGGDEA